MQYTGFKDKNGKDIYEGDLLSYEIIGPNNTVIKNETYEAVWNVIDASACFRNTDSENPFSVKGFAKSNMTVIGNIYENPELVVRDNRTTE